MSELCKKCKYTKIEKNCKFKMPPTEFYLHESCSRPDNEFDGLCSCEACPLLQFKDYCKCLQNEITVWITKEDDKK